VTETARAFNETAIGIISASGDVTLAPDPTYPLNFQAGDRIVVVAEEHVTTKAKTS
jgi:K+/H+ antiporter YhaU regulatory subunit KhtT